MILIGLDPGFAAFGMVAWCDGRFTRSQVWRSARGEDAASVDNLLRGRSMAESVRNFGSGATGVCVEAMSFARHASTAHKMGIAWGVLAATVDAPVFQLSPQKVRKLLGLNLGATKGDIQRVVLRLHPELEALQPKQTGLWEHHYDAAAVLVAWMQTEEGRFLVGKATNTEEGNG